MYDASPVEHTVERGDDSEGDDGDGSDTDTGGHSGWVGAWTGKGMGEGGGIFG